MGKLNSKCMKATSNLAFGPNVHCDRACVFCSFHERKREFIYRLIGMISPCDGGAR